MPPNKTNNQLMLAFNQSNEISELKKFNSAIEFRLNQAALMIDCLLRQ